MVHLVVLPLRHRGAAELDGGAARVLQHGRMSHGGKAIEGIAPSANQNPWSKLHTRPPGDLNAANGRQHAPGVLLRRRPALLELHDLVVDLSRCCGDMTVGREQVILRLDGLRASAVGRARPQIPSFSDLGCTHAARDGRYALIIGSVIAVRRLAVPRTRRSSGSAAGATVRERIGRQTVHAAITWTIPVLQGQRAVRPAS